MDLFSTQPEPVRGLRILAANVQSPPQKRGVKLASAIREANPNIVVLSELSNANGSRELLEELQYVSGFNVAWDAPKKGDYSVAICTKELDLLAGDIAIRKFSERIKVVKIKGANHVLSLCGVYAPALNATNMSRRMEYFTELERILSDLSPSSSQLLMLTGDLNAIAKDHYPMFDAFDREGYPIDRIAEKLSLTPLIKNSKSKKNYTWFPPGEIATGQLLDNFYVSRHAHKFIQNCSIVHSFRTRGLSDHSAIVLEGFH